MATCLPMPLEAPMTSATGLSGLLAADMVMVMDVIMVVVTLGLRF